VLAEVRTRELEKAFAELGLDEHIWLDYPDGGCAAVDEKEAVARVTDLINQVQPDTVLTFGPDGMTGHDDHIRVSQWTTLAVGRSGSKAGLHYATKTPDFMELMREAATEIWESMVSMGGAPSVTPLADTSIYLRAEGELLDAKVRALAHQVSQTEPLIGLMGDDAYRRMIAEEIFRPAP
jgi:LmbE family N-acetylglucosaminyl deacetylase